MHSPSILFINRVYPPSNGATGRLLQDLAQYFAAEGWDVQVLCAGDEAGIFQDGPIKIKRVKAPAQPKHWTSYVSLWVKLFLGVQSMGRADIVVTMTDPPLLIDIGRHYAANHSAKHIHWCHDLYPQLFPVLGVDVPDWIMAHMERISARGLEDAHKVIVTGRCMAKRLKHLGLAASKMVYIPNWPDKELLADHVEASKLSQAAQQTDKSKELLSSGPKFRVLYAGTIGLAHPLKAILEAAEILKDDHPEIEFTFVGEGRRRDKLLAERNRRELENINFLPYQPKEKLKKIMQSGDVHLVTMLEDAAGYLVPSKIYAAIAAHRPVIMLGPKQSEAARIIKQFGCGQVVKSTDGKALAKAIKHYRLESGAWFEAKAGSEKSSAVYRPEESMKAWLKRAMQLVQGTDKS